jgi:hypothetical protein
MPEGADKGRLHKTEILGVSLLTRARAPQAPAHQEESVDEGFWHLEH